MNQIARLTNLIQGAKVKGTMSYGFAGMAWRSHERQARGTPAVQ